MHKELFLKIMEVVVVHDFYFVQKRDATGLSSFSSIQKCLKKFVKVIWTCFESSYLKQLATIDIKKHMKINE